MHFSFALKLNNSVDSYKALLQKTKKQDYKTLMSWTLGHFQPLSPLPYFTPGGGLMNLLCLSCGTCHVLLPVPRTPFLFHCK